MFLVTGLGGCLASTAALCACQACTCVSREMLRKSARLAYCTLFFAAVVLSWVLRDFAKPLIEKLPCMSSYRDKRTHQQPPPAPPPPVCCCWHVRHASCFLTALILSGAGILPGSGIHPSDRWYGQQAVYRLSMGNFVRRSASILLCCIHAC